MNPKQRKRAVSGPFAISTRNLESGTLATQRRQLRVPSSTVRRVLQLPDWHDRRGTAPTRSSARPPAPPPTPLPPAGPQSLT